MKMILRTLIAIACVATMSFAQAEEGNGQTQSGKTTRVYVAEMPPEAVINNDLSFAVSIHPISMLVYTGILGIPSIYATIEIPVATSLSLITRPFYLGKEWDDDYETVDLNMFGISEGIRYYFSRGHQGYFGALHFEYDYVGIDYTYDNRDSYIKLEKVSASGNAISFGFYIGGSSRSGHFTQSWDIGVTYRECFVDGDGEDDVEEVVFTGVGIDANYTIGFAL